MRIIFIRTRIRQFLFLVALLIRSGIYLVWYPPSTIAIGYKMSLLPHRMVWYYLLIGCGFIDMKTHPGQFHLKKITFKVVSGYIIKNCLYIYFFKCSAIINVQPPPLLTDYCCCYCARGFRYIFHWWIIIIIKPEEYLAITGDIFNIPIIINKKGKQWQVVHQLSN